MMRIAHLVFLATALLLTNCINSHQIISGPIHSGPSLTLEDAIQQSNGCTNPLRDVAIQRNRSLGNQIIVLYTATCPGDPDLPRDVSFFGYAIVDKENGLWMARSGTAVEMQMFPPDQLIYLGQAGSNGIPVIFGRALKSNVAAIEVTLENGQVKRDKVEGGVFVILLDANVNAQALRIIGDQNEILQEQDLITLSSSK